MPSYADDSLETMLTGPIVVGDDGAAGGADAMAFATTLAGDGGREVIVARTDPGPRVDRSLGELARREAAGLVVIGSHEPGHGHVHGAITERLLHDARCPVAVVPSGWAADPHPLRVVGVAFDGRPESRVALTLARHLAEHAQAAMRVIAVARPAPAVRTSALAAPSSAAVATDPLPEALHDAVEALPHELRALSILEHGDPAERLADESGKGLDVLVCGSRGHGPVGSVLLGSVSRTLTRAAQCPVLVVPRGAVPTTPSS